MIGHIKCGEEVEVAALDCKNLNFSPQPHKHRWTSGKKQKKHPVWGLELNRPV